MFCLVRDRADVDSSMTQLIRGNFVEVVTGFASNAVAAKTSQFKTSVNILLIRKLRTARSN